MTSLTSASASIATATAPAAVPLRDCVTATPISQTTSHGYTFTVLPASAWPEVVHCLGPNVPGLNVAGTSTPGTAATSKVTPADSGLACDDQVCQQIFGTGLHVSDLQTLTNGPIAGPGVCSKADYFFDGVFTQESALKCNNGSVPTTLIIDTAPFTEQKNVSACSQMTTFPGTPCNDIHS